MPVYIVHEPPLRAADARPDPEQFAFVREGFSVWAFLFATLWMLWHRMWLVLLIYVVVAAGLETALYYAGVSDLILGLIAILISLLVGFEASTLRRFTLDRRGWKNIGVVSGDSLEMAERRFFDAWVRDTPLQRAAAAPPPRPTASVPHTPPSPDVIGLFPEPGANR
jgi:hypothetical protein